MNKINVLTFTIQPKDGVSWGRGPSSVTQNLVSRARGMGYDVVWYLIVPQIQAMKMESAPDVG